MCIFMLQILYTSYAWKQMCGALLHCPQSHQVRLAKMFYFCATAENITFEKLDIELL